MAGGAPSGDDEPITAINVTPLVDIVLVLLIILMVTANYIASKTIPVDLPQASTGESTNAVLAITIDKDGKLFLDAASVTEPQLRQGVKAAHDRDRDVRAVIAADGRIAHANVVRIINLLREEGVTKFAINVRPEDLGR
jgi:biopolymer transport protein ExbD